ncbi:DUF1996 domain-containing protein [Streptacidiphilus sp. PAMC 29251]
MTEYPPPRRPGAPPAEPAPRPARHRLRRGRVVLAVALAAGLVLAGRVVVAPVFGDAAQASEGGRTAAATGQPSTAAGMPSMPGMPGTSPSGAPATLPADATLPQKVVPTRTFSGPPPQAQYHEIHADCTATRQLSDDPIVYPGQPGASHNHTFIGNRGTDADSTPASLRAGGGTSCQDQGDTSGYWFPTLYQNDKVVNPTTVTVYYKSGVKDYRTVMPFPQGFRLIVGDMHTPSAADFKGNWRCGNQVSDTFPSSCPAGSSLVVHLQAPSCWDGIHLDTADHRSHMAYPVKGVCPAAFPVPLPMLEIKVPYQLPGGSTAGLRYSSGASYSFHYDFMNGWQQPRLEQLVAHCINGGRQCNGYGVDQHKP